MVRSGGKVAAPNHSRAPGPSAPKKSSRVVVDEDVDRAVQLVSEQLLGLGHATGAQLAHVPRHLLVAAVPVHRRVADHGRLPVQPRPVVVVEERGLRAERRPSVVGGPPLIGDLRIRHHVALGRVPDVGRLVAVRLHRGHLGRIRAGEAHQQLQLIRRSAGQVDAERHLLAEGGIGLQVGEAGESEGRGRQRAEQQHGHDQRSCPSQPPHDTLPKSRMPVVRLPSPRRPGRTSHQPVGYDHGISGACSST